MTKGIFISIFAIVAAQASTITGALWQVSDGIAQNAILANIPATPPDVTFSVNAFLNFDNGGTVIAFLNSGGAFNILGSSSALNRSISPSIVQFTGTVTVTNGQSFSATHDDGLTLVIGGVPVIVAPGPTSPALTAGTYTGPSGTFDFTLVYGECCSGDAVLSIDLETVPEPATFALTGIALLLIGARFGRRCSRP